MKVRLIRWGELIFLIFAKQEKCGSFFVGGSDLYILFTFVQPLYVMTLYAWWKFAKSPLLLLNFWSHRIIAVYSVAKIYMRPTLPAEFMSLWVFLNVIPMKCHTIWLCLLCCYEDMLSNEQWLIWDQSEGYWVLNARVSLILGCDRWVQSLLMGFILLNHALTIYT